MEDLFEQSIINVRQFMEKTLHFIQIVENGKNIKERIDQVL